MEIPPSELLKRVYDLEQLGFSVSLEHDEKGLFLKIKKEKPNIRKFRLQ